MSSGTDGSFCQEDALIVYEGGLADEAQCTAPPGPVLVKVRTSGGRPEDRRCFVSMAWGTAENNRTHF